MTVAERRKQEREERRHLILDAAERVFYERGLDAATMEDVAAEARLGKGTLYLYFRNKDDLRWAVACRRQEALLEHMAQVHASSATGLSELRSLLLAYAERVSTPIEHLQMLLSCWVAGTNLHDDLPSASEHREVVRRTFGTICSAIERGRGDGSIRLGLPAPRTALQLWSAVNGALLLKLQLTHMRSVDSLTEIEPGLVAPSLDESVDAILDGVRVHGHSTTSDIEADSTPEPAVVADEEAHSKPVSEPRAAAAADEPSGGVQC